MTIPQADPEAEPRAPARLLDVLIRAALIGGMAVLCYRIFSPFLSLMAWAIILAVTMYPVHQWLANRVGRRQWLASTILVVVTFIAIVVPTALLLNSVADSVRHFISDAETKTLDIPWPPEGVKKWPIIGPKVFEAWSKAHDDPPGLVKAMRPDMREVAHKALSIVATVGGSLLLLLGSLIIASIVMAYGESGSRNSTAFFNRVAGPERGPALANLSRATIRAVALGVIGVAFIQAILVGVALLLADVPAAGLLSIVVLVLAIAQLPAALVTLPIIAYIWWSGEYSSAAAVVNTVVLLVVGLLDNVLKPLFLGRGVDVPMPVILLGALGGVASGGILGMFVGATVLAVGYAIFKSWLDANPASELGATESESQPLRTEG